MAVEILCALCGSLQTVVSLIDHNTEVKLMPCPSCYPNGTKTGRTSYLPEGFQGETSVRPDPLRKPLLDWYHRWGSSKPVGSLAQNIFQAIEEVYGVDVIKREVPKE